MESEQGVGTTFHTFIPAAKDKKETLTVITETDFKGSGCVLVMDDEEMIRELDTRIPVFVASGYSEDTALARPEEFGFTASLEKPFEHSQLAKMFQAHVPPET